MTDLTQQKDYKRAKIALTDEDGRVADLHALRGTLGTRLARHGAPPQLASDIMRHGDIRTTMRYYTFLGLSDTAAVMNRLPAIGEASQARATGTGGAEGSGDPQQIPQQSGHETAPEGASPCENAERESEDDDEASTDSRATTVRPKRKRGARLRDPVRRDAMDLDDSKRPSRMSSTQRAGVTQLVECQLPKLNVAGSNPVTRSSFSSCAPSLPLAD